MRLWIESAHQSLIKIGGDAISTFQSEEQFFAIIVSGLQIDQMAKQAVAMLEHQTPPGTVAEKMLAALPEGSHVPFAILQVLGKNQASLVECDAPPLFITRGGDLVLLPVIEEESHGHLIRTCEFSLQDGDHIAIVSEGLGSTGRF